MRETGLVSSFSMSSSGIEMTSPVMQDEPEKIEMTAPVMQDAGSKSGTWRTRFVMPAGYTVDTLPPAPQDITLTQIDERKNRRLEEAQHDRDAARNGIHDSYRLIVLALAALPGILLGLWTYQRRSARASSIVPSNRLVGGTK